MNFIDYIILGILVATPVLFGLIRTSKHFVLTNLFIAVAVGGIGSVAILKAVVNSQVWTWLLGVTNNQASTTNIIFWVVFGVISLVSLGILSLIRGLVLLPFDDRSHILGLIDGLLVGAAAVFIAMAAFILIVDLGQFQVDPAAIESLNQLKAPLNESFFIGTILKGLQFTI